MSLYIYSNPPSLTQPELGFIVYHHHVELSPSEVAIHTTVIGIYPSFTVAQKAALDALHIAIAGYERAGVRGNVSKVINLVLRGLITGIGRDGMELPISEFEIRPMRVWNETWRPQMGNEEENALMRNEDREGKVQIEVKLPWAKPVPMPKNEQAGRATRFPEETDPYWVQTRIPYFRRRDETPLRRADDPPYSANLGFVCPPLRSHQRSVRQIVAQQPDELLEPSDEEQRPTRESQEPQSGAVAVVAQEQESKKEPRELQSEVVGVTEEPTTAMKMKQSKIDEEKEISTIAVREVQVDEDNSSRESSTSRPPRDLSPLTDSRRS